MITLTDSAQEKISEILIEENTPEAKLRMFVVGGGCSGFQYGFEITTEKNDDDFEVAAVASSVLVDSVSAQYLEGVVVDFKDDLQGARFTISNPKAVTTCGCGNSFSPF